MCESLTADQNTLLDAMENTLETNVDSGKPVEDTKTTSA